MGDDTGRAQAAVRAELLKAPGAHLTAAPFNARKSRSPVPATADSVAPAMVRGWPAARRARIRVILTTLALARDGPDLTSTPEMRVVAMIDRIGAQQSPGGSRQGAAAGQREGQA